MSGAAASTSIGTIDHDAVPASAGAPTIKRPAYMAYAAEPADPQLTELALDGLRRAAARDSED